MLVYKEMWFFFIKAHADVMGYTGIKHDKSRDLRFSRDKKWYSTIQQTETAMNFQTWRWDEEKIPGISLGQGGPLSDSINFHDEC